MHFTEGDNLKWGCQTTNRNWKFPRITSYIQNIHIACLLVCLFVCLKHIFQFFWRKWLFCKVICMTLNPTKIPPSFRVANLQVVAWGLLLLKVKLWQLPYWNGLMNLSLPFVSPRAQTSGMGVLVKGHVSTWDWKVRKEVGNGHRLEIWRRMDCCERITQMSGRKGLI